MLTDNEFAQFLERSALARRLMEIAPACEALLRAVPLAAAAVRHAVRDLDIVGAALFSGVIGFAADKGLDARRQCRLVGLPWVARRVPWQEAAGSNREYFVNIAIALPPSVFAQALPGLLCGSANEIAFVRAAIPDDHQPGRAHDGLIWAALNASKVGEILSAEGRGGRRRAVARYLAGRERITRGTGARRIIELALGPAREHRPATVVVEGNPAYQSQLEDIFSEAVMRREMLQIVDNDMARCAREMARQWVAPEREEHWPALAAGEADYHLVLEAERIIRGWDDPDRPAARLAKRRGAVLREHLPRQIAGFDVVVLDSERELAEEGRRLAHCLAEPRGLARYLPAFRAGTAVFISLRRRRAPAGTAMKAVATAMIALADARGQRAGQVLDFASAAPRGSALNADLYQMATDLGRAAARAAARAVPGRRGL